MRYSSTKAMDPQPTARDDDDDEILASVADMDNAIALALLIVRRFWLRQRRVRKGSTRGRMKARQRNIEFGHESIMRDYLGPDPIYNEP
jgi:hypothetical protein